MNFLRKAHLIMRQYFHMIGCNVSKKGAFSALKMITADEMPSIVKKGAAFFENIIFFIKSGKFSMIFSKCKGAFI